MDIACACLPASGPSSSNALEVSYPLHLAQGAFVPVPVPPLSPSFLRLAAPSSLVTSSPPHQPPTHRPCTTTRFPTTSPRNIFLSPACGFFQFGI